MVNKTVELILIFSVGGRVQNSVNKQINKVTSDIKCGKENKAEVFIRVSARNRGVLKL